MLMFSITCDAICISVYDFLVLECFYYSFKFFLWVPKSNYSWTTYLRVHTTSPTHIVVINSFSVNSRITVDDGLPICFWMNLLPSFVTVLLTLRPSLVSSSYSSSNLNVSEKLLIFDVVTKVYWSPSFFNSMVATDEFASLRRTNPTPVRK